MRQVPIRNIRRPWRNVLLAVIPVAIVAGCATSEVPQKRNDFFTSGSREADQRADQRIAKDQQLKGAGAATPAAAKTPADHKEETRKTLYERIGGAVGVDEIVNDFIDRVLADPRVNWERKGITQGGFSFHRSSPVTTWQANPQTVDTLKRHMAQFIALATGGPIKYDGREMTQVHGGLHISNAEFDAAVGDLKASLDKLQTPIKEQKELLAVMESTRPQVVQDR